MNGLRMSILIFLFIGWIPITAGAFERNDHNSSHQGKENVKLREEVIWSYTAPEDNGDINAPRALDDVNGDGVTDIVVCIYDAGYGYDDLLCFSGASQDAEIIWSIDSQQGVSGSGGYGQECIDIIPDVDGDTIDDVLYGTAWGGRTIYCRSGASGSLIWYLDTYDLPNSGWIYDVAPYADINGDGTPEALAAVGNDTKTVFCISGASTGSAEILWSFSAPDGFLTVDTIRDVDGDGIDDVVAGNGTNYEDDRVFCLRGDPEWPGNREFWSFHTGSVVRSVISTVDTNDDSVEDVIAGSGSDVVFCLSGSDGSIIWSRDLYHDIIQVTPLGDVTGDNIPEILVGASTNAVNCLDGSTGSVLWSTPTGTANGGYVWSVACLDDISGDGLPDAIAGSFDTKIYVLRGTDGLVLGTFSTSRRVYGVASAPDVNNDGYDEILGGTQGLYGSQSTLYCLSGAHYRPLQPEISLMDNRYTLAWSPFQGSDAYWIFGEENLPYFEPKINALPSNRLVVLSSSETNWISDLGLSDTDSNWTFLIMAVDEYGDEIVRSSFIGEFDFQLAIP